MMCVVDNDGVGIGNVYAIFHDRRRQQHVIVVIDESHDYLLQLLWLHLPMSYCHTAIGNILMDKLLYVGQA